MASTTVPPEPDEGSAAEPVRKPTTNRKAPAPRSGLLTVAALASLSAGVIHATAAGSHSEHRQAVVAFSICAAFQVAWGIWALLRSGRLLILVGAAGNAAAVGGWVVAKTSSDGLSFIDGLNSKEPAQFADTLCAVLAAIAVLAAVAAAVGLFDLGRWAVRPSFMGVAALATLFISVPGMIAAGNHTHAHGTDAHSHGAAGHTHVAAAVPPHAFDPKLPIDLSGVSGVTPEEQAKAENLLAENLIRLPQWADTKTAEAHGYHSIGDALTGDEHYINWQSIDDKYILDPDHPESLVYHVERGADGKWTKTLEAAMYMLPQGSTLDSVPDVGGALTQWHIHDNLCFSKDPVAPRVAGITTSNGGCPPGLQKFKPVPMMHVWILPNPCGPFAALEGVGAGQIKAGQTRACDHVHGSSE
jgi:hypothetical protein